MDAALVDRLSRGEGWALLSALPPYDEATSLSLQESLRGRQLIIGVDRLDNSKGHKHRFNT